MLEKAEKGIRSDQPIKWVLAGSSGAGKSTCASQMPAPFVADIENGSNFLNVSRIEITNLKDFVDLCTEFAEGEHEYQTFIVDSYDWAAKFMEEKVIAEGKKKSPQIKSLADFEWGAGHTRLAQINDGIVHLLDNIYRSGFNVCVICHTHVKAYKADPMVEPYMKHQLKLPAKVAEKLQEWADFVSLAYHDVWTRKEGQGIAKRIIPEGDPLKRWLMTAGATTFNAKSRTPVLGEANEPVVELSWKAFCEGIERGRKHGT